MKLHNYCQQAFVNLMAAKLRSFLAVLGILVGTAAVVALVSSGYLATEKALEQFRALGTDLLAITVFPKSTSTPSGRMTNLPLDFWRRIPQMIPEVLQIAPYAMAYQNLSFQGKPLTGVVIGADESLAKIIHIHVAKGHFVSFVDSFEHFCVIGDGLAQVIRSVSMDNPIGKQLRIGQSLYTIIGIADPWRESGFFNEDINQAVIVPIVGTVLINKEARVNNAVLLLKSNINIDEIIARIKEVIAKQAPSLSVFIRSAKQIIASMQTQGQIFTLLLAVIGGVSLLVGGIGVMNVMLVAVTERKKEIGIRKAVGATRREIQILFLIESIILSLLGGVCGVIVGIILTGFIAYFSHWPFKINLLPPLIGFIVSALTGIFFGFYPAKRAAALEPIVSLRSE